MNPNWIGAELIVVVGAFFLLGVMALACVARYSAPLSRTAELRWQSAFFWISALSLTFLCWDMLHQSKVNGTGLTTAALFMNLMADAQGRITVRRGRPLYCVGFCLGLAVVELTCELCSAPFFQDAQRVICHPGFVVPFWFFFMWQFFKIWRENQALRRNAEV